MKEFEEESLMNTGLALVVAIFLIISAILLERIPADNEFFIVFALSFLMFQTVSIMGRINRYKAGSR